LGGRGNVNNNGDGQNGRGFGRGQGNGNGRSNGQKAEENGQGFGRGQGNGKGEAREMVKEMAMAGSVGKMSRNHLREGEMAMDNFRDKVLEEVK